ncbi:ABC transporter permease [Vulgatibacter sp.]|uniref:ABC transporter permease n=1 Tax=Vulgatibacter sp. TaxID=1971226 RepID=UPI003562E857
MKAKSTRAAVYFLGAWVLVALAAPWIAPFDPQALGEHPLAPPSATHLLGADSLGRDLLSRVLHGARISLQVAAVSVAFALLVGGTLGLLAGHFGGWIDGAISRSTDVLFALPEVLLALVLLAILGTGLINLTLAIGIVYTPIFARIGRAAAIEERSRSYVEAARALGAGELRIVFRHLLPNVAPPLLVQTTLSFAFAILAEAALGFLGLGGEPDLPSWGNMLRDGKDWLEQAWWVAMVPGLAISAAVLALNVLGDGLRDALDPHVGP